MKKAKKAQLGNAITWLYKFLIVIAVVGSITYVIASHYSKKIDIRNLEASAISEKIVECIVEKGLDKASENSIKNCLNLDENEVFVNVSFQDKTITFGNDFLATLCKSKEKGVKLTYYPCCFKQKVLLLDQHKKLSELSISVFIKKVRKNL